VRRGLAVAPSGNFNAGDAVIEAVGEVSLNGEHADEGV
jgi:hypothetical protein